jgi:hypothetical protein
MLDKFEKGKRYIYDLDTVLQDDWVKRFYETGYNKYLMDSCNGQEVIVISETEGRIYFSNDDSYFISPKSCKEV